MHLEIQVALNFLISYLYNQLPRRRVNLFGEECEKGLRLKFSGHWYTDQPMKGSAFRMITITNFGWVNSTELHARYCRHTLPITYGICKCA